VARTAVNFTLLEQEAKGEDNKPGPGRNTLGIVLSSLCPHHIKSVFDERINVRGVWQELTLGSCESRGVTAVQLE
jgi:hypothetical protein